MEPYFPIMFASLVGIGHAFEADHLIAMGNIISRRDNFFLAIKDGFFWGLGHTTTLVILGTIVILSRATFLDSSIFEAVVGGMLVIMGISRLTNGNNFTARQAFRYQHGLAYTVGLIHGLAGSGALLLLVMSEIKDAYLSILYLLVFGAGSIIGMFIAAGLFNIPFTTRMKINSSIKGSLVIASSLICIGYGGWVMYKNLNGVVI